MSRLRACAQRLKGTFLQQSEGSLTIKFFNGLKPSILKLVEDSAPVGWWTSTEQVFQKAINFELNQAAALGRQHVQSVTPAEDISASSGLPVKRRPMQRSQGRRARSLNRLMRCTYHQKSSSDGRQPSDAPCVVKQAISTRKCTNERTAQPFA